MNISVVGLGKIGLPLAVQFASKGNNVIGLDINQTTVDKVNQGKVPFPGESGLEEKLLVEIKLGRLRATTSASKAITSAQVVVVVVPLYLDSNSSPDFSMLDSALEEVGKHLRPSALISIETTVPVGTTRERVAPILEKFSGLKSGVDFFVVFSPERVLSGRVFSDLRNYPKIVGGVNELSLMHGVNFYQKVLDFEERSDLVERGNGVWSVGSTESAELVKLAETTYRDVNISLANLFAMFAEKNNIDIYEVIRAANSQPYSHIHQPGVAVGGHCIPIYPHLYLQNDPAAELIRVAREYNLNMANLAAARIDNLVGGIQGKVVAVLGASYRGGVKEISYSGAFQIKTAFEKMKAKVLVHDTLFSEDELDGFGFQAFRRGMCADVAILQASHIEYLGWEPRDIPSIQVMYDGRNFLDPTMWKSIKYLRIGV